MSATLLVIALGGFAGGYVNGLAGFGTGLFALGFWLNVLPPVQAVAMSVVVAAVTGVQGLWVVRRDIAAQTGRVLRFLLPAFLGLPFGLLALGFVEPRGLKLFIAVVLFAYGVFFLVRRSLPRIETERPLVDLLIGWVSGILGGFAGLSGAFLVLWCTLQPWTKGETRAVLQPLNFTVLTVMAGIFAARGVYTGALLPHLALAVCCSLIAAQLGIATFRRISDIAFRWLLIAMMSLSGAVLLLRTLFEGA